MSRADDIKRDPPTCPICEERKLTLLDFRWDDVPIPVFLCALCGQEGTLQELTMLSRLLPHDHEEKEEESWEAQERKEELEDRGEEVE